MRYYVIRNKETGFYYRGKGANQWGKYHNQASIYRIPGMVKTTAKDVERRNKCKVEIIPINIIEEI